MRDYKKGHGGVFTDGVGGEETRGEARRTPEKGSVQYIYRTVSTTCTMV